MFYAKSSSRREKSCFVNTGISKSFLSFTRSLHTNNSKASFGNNTFISPNKRIKRSLPDYKWPRSRRGPSNVNIKLYRQFCSLSQLWVPFPNELRDEERSRAARDRLIARSRQAEESESFRAASERPLANIPTEAQEGITPERWQEFVEDTRGLGRYSSSASSVDTDRTCKDSASDLDSYTNPTTNDDPGSGVANLATVEENPDKEIAEYLPDPKMENNDPITPTEELIERYHNNKEGLDEHIEDKKELVRKDQEKYDTSLHSLYQQGIIGDRSLDNLKDTSAEYSEKIIDHANQTKTIILEHFDVAESIEKEFGTKKAESKSEPSKESSNLDSSTTKQSPIDYVIEKGDTEMPSICDSEE